MFSATVMPISIHRACGHCETAEFRYRGMREKTQQMDIARRAVCKDCRALIQSWLADSNGSAPFPVVLPELCGSDKQVRWAESIRAAQLPQLLGAMTAASEHGGKIGSAVWQALFLIVTQRQAKFWIDNREVGFSWQYIETEASYLAAGATYGVVFSDRSVFGRLKKCAPHVIEDARRRCPVLPVRSIA